MTQHTSTKETILIKSYDLFHSHGYHATSMCDISKAVGMTKAGLYHHFESKEDLMINVLKNIQQYLSEHLYTIAYETDSTPVVRLKKFLSKQEEIFLGNQRACFIGSMTLESARKNKEFALILDAIFAEWEAALAHLYSGTHTKKKAKDLAEQTVIEFEGAVMLGMLRKNDKTILKKAMVRARARLSNTKTKE